MRGITFLAPIRYCLYAQIGFALFLQCKIVEEIRKNVKGTKVSLLVILL